MKTHILALDQGTTSSRAIVFDSAANIVATAQAEFPQIYPGPGFVDHDPEEIWRTQLATAKQALLQAKLSAADLVGIGITNQRETTVLWEKSTGKPVANAIVWQSRVSAPICERMKGDGLEPMIRKKTGLVLDAYFSASKIKHLLDTMPGLRERSERGEILFGTIDTFLLWRLTGGKVHATDVSNASRTMLLNIHTLDWDDELLTAFGVPRQMLPEVKSSSEIFGATDETLFDGAIPIAGIAGDQQAATFGQACFESGEAKNTYGTGCFLLLNTGDKPMESKNQLLTTVGWRIGDKTTYCLEGSVFIGGAVIQWLRDGLRAIKESSDVQALAAQVSDSGGVYFVPAFVGLGAPYWDSNARGAILGITRGTTIEHIARAAVESMAFQSADLLDAMQKDSGVPLASLKVDGGACKDNILMQFQSDILNLSVLRPNITETTALGAAFLAGLSTGLWSTIDELHSVWQLDREFKPLMSPSDSIARWNQWRKAVGRSLSWSGS